METPFSLDQFIKNFCELDMPAFEIPDERDPVAQRTLHVDVARTKSGILTQAEKDDLEIMLTYYCKSENHTYKQGMNEILVPFLLMNREGIPRHLIYTCFSKFIEKFISNLFRDDFFKPLYGLFHKTRLVLMYHYPEIQNFFELNSISPDMYMTSWFVTMFAGKIKVLPLLYKFWDKLNSKEDFMYLSYFGVALLGHYSQLILNHDQLTLPNVFKELKIDDWDTLNRIMMLTDEIMFNMPYTSAWILLEYNVFDLEKCENFSVILEEFPSLLMLPRGIISQLFSHNLICNCTDVANCEIQRHRYTLIDCRPPNEVKLGHFVNSTFLSKGALKSPIKLKEFPNKFMTLKGNNHIVLMGSTGKNSETSYFSQLVKAFHEKGFKYISCVEGGYEECHKFALSNKLPILQHKEKNCPLCCDKEKKGSIESTLDKFFRLDTSKKATDISNEKVYKCKINEEQDINESGIGLCVTPKVLVVIDTKTGMISEELLIERLSKITCSKNKNEVLSFSFRDNTKRVWILDHGEVKEFLNKVRANYSDMKKVKNTIKNLI